MTRVGQANLDAPKNSMNIEATGNVKLDEVSFTEREKEWVARSRQGDEEAFKMLFEYYFPKIYGTMFQMTQNVSTAEELAQAALVQSWQRLDRFDGRSAFGTWLYRVAVNLALDFLRRRKNRSMDSLEETMEAGFDPSGQAVDPAGPLHTNEISHLIQQAIAKLSPSHRAVFVLGEIEGKPYEEIAQILKCRRGTVMSRMHYARLHLQRLLRPYYERQR